MRSPRVVLCAVLLLLCAGVALGWDKEGHEAIGMTAMSALKGKALQQVKRLMGGKDVVDISDWAHKVNKLYPWTEKLHFQPQAEWGCKLDFNSCPANVCLVSAVKHFYGRLTNKKIGESANLKYPEDMKLTDADALKFLISLIADMHQPMHLGFGTDDCGREFNATYRGQPSSLFEVFDTKLVQTSVSERPGFWYGGWTHVNAVKQLFETEKAEWQAKDHEMFDRWAEENVQTACTKIYKDPSSNERLTKGFVVSPHVERLWTETMQNRILVAGARIAIVLNSILEQRDASRLRQGTAIQAVDEDGNHPDGPSRVSLGVPNWVRNLFINLIIIAVILGVFAYVSTFYSGPPTGPSVSGGAAKKVKAADDAAAADSGNSKDR